MRTTQDLTHKWETIREEGGAIEAFGDGVGAPDRFVMVYRHHGGDGTMSVDVTGVGAFEDPSDALAYLRYVELPVLLEWQEVSAGSSLDPDMDLDEHHDRMNAATTSLAALLEELVDSDLTAEVLEDTRQAFNAAFDRADPGATIEVWGSVTEVLASDYAAESLEDAGEADTFAPLLQAIDAGLFQPDDPRQFAAAAVALQLLERS
jgi:hypothetical protein